MHNFPPPKAINRQLAEGDGSVFRGGVKVDKGIHADLAAAIHLHQRIARDEPSLFHLRICDYFCAGFCQTHVL